MIEALLNAMRMEAQKAVGTRAQAKKGIVTGYDSTNYCAKVLLQPEGTETGWLPIGSDWVGNGWGMFSPPSIGDMVQVEFDEGDWQSGSITKRFFNDEDRPLAVEAGELWLVHKSGSLLKFTNDGDVILVTDRDLSATVGRNLDASVAGDASIAVTGDITSSATLWTHTGPVTVLGLVTADALVSTGLGGNTNIGAGMVVTGNVYTLGDIYNNGKDIGSTHKHSGVQSGGSNTGNPI